MFEGEEAPDEKPKEGQPEVVIDKDDNLLRVWFNFISSIHSDIAWLITLCLQTVLCKGPCQIQAMMKCVTHSSCLLINRGI
jgi:hypothetical protein